MIDVIRPKSNKENKVVRALTIEEQEAFTNWLVDKPIDEFKYRNVYLLQMYTGLRVGEALALTTHDIDLKNKRLNISLSLNCSKTEVYVFNVTVISLCPINL